MKLWPFVVRAAVPNDPAQARASCPTKRGPQKGKQNVGAGDGLSVCICSANIKVVIMEKRQLFGGGGVFTLHSWFILDDTGWDPSQSFQRLAPPPWESPDQLVDPNQALRSPAFRLALPPTSCVALSKTRHFSGLQRSHLEQVGLGNSPTPNPALLPFLHTRPPSPLLTPSGECPSFFTEITYSYKK